MKKFLFTFLLLVILATRIAVADVPSTYTIPRSFDFGAHYYYAYGSPDINATIVGTNEFDRDQTITLPIDLMNRGKFLGFERDHTPATFDETYAAQTEVKLETKIVDATAIVASLSVDPDSPLEVKSPAQQVGSIKSGENSPVKFDIKIDKKAKAGTYNLYLNLTYDYQKYVQIANPNATAQTYDASYWYAMMNQSQTLKFIVKTQADFEVVRTTGSLFPGREDVVEIAIKNTGEEEARDAKAIINPGDPLSTTDDQAFLYTIKPGDVVVARYKIKADPKAEPKTYGVDTVIRYENLDGDIKYSTTLQAPVDVKEIGFFQRLFGWLY
ncbi:NPCBM-associated, NEW3 domain of alpha-galactosidase [uncultured archaeon]|nr:NPCBM-associated, NEW3 domain of alpha-galactosidase [uncultured archaeon]